MVGMSRYCCNQKIESVTAFVQLEENVGGSWKVVADNGEGGQKTVAPIADKTYTTQANYSCRDGVFRTASRGYGYYDGRRSQSTAWDYSQAVTNPCS
jgi:hypothetical protein